MKLFPDFSDGAPSHFQNHSNMINLLNHKNDFNIEACWTFSAIGHGKSPCDGLEAAVKSSANRHILMSGVTLSSAKDFYEFTKKFNQDMAKRNNTNEPPIITYYLKSITIDNVTEALLADRLKNLSSNRSNLLNIVLKRSILGRIKDLRQFHQFEPKDFFTILCRKTSSSFVTEEFILQKKREAEDECLQKIKTLKDIKVYQFVIVQYQEKKYLAKVVEIKELEKIITVQCYQPPFPMKSYVRLFKQMETYVKIFFKHIISAVVFQPTYGRRSQLSLSKDQFIIIQKLCN